MLTTWLVVGVLMLTCGVAMARLLWSRRRTTTAQPSATTGPQNDERPAPGPLLGVQPHLKP